MSVVLHFHPDWPAGPMGAVAGEQMVIEALAHDGVYRSQFETGTSNGGLTAQPGGDRWRWESRLFGGRYDAGPPSARPVYGAVDTGGPYGAAPRFGSAFLRLRSSVDERATFCFPDSVFEPASVAGPDGVSELVARCAAADLDDDLDRYVEAHVHGGVRLEHDVESVVLDPCFRDGPVHAAARRIAEIEWHPGFRVETEGLDPAYRGAEVVGLAQRLGPSLVPAVLGAAARGRAHDPQALKRVWHLLARFGRAPGGASSSGV